MSKSGGAVIGLQQHQNELLPEDDFLETDPILPTLRSMPNASISSSSQQQLPNVRLAALNAHGSTGTPLPGASGVDTDFFDGWGADKLTSRAGKSVVSQDNGIDATFEEVLGCDPFAAVSGLQGLRARSEGEFETIDWTFYQEKDRQYRRKMNRMIRSQTPLMRFMYQFYDAVQSWLVLLVVGFFIGLVAACLDIASDWSNDVKFGICQRGFWIPRHMCCRDSPTISECTQWTTWGQFFSSTKGAIETLNYFFYVAFAVGMASLAAYLVLVFAPTAAGSGIAEVKVILGGFGIRNFLSGWTLLIKSIGLVLSTGSGLPLGKEGPFVHVACCVANLCSQRFSKYLLNEGKKRELLSGAAAAGMSVGFGAPVGGVLFSLEEVSSFFPPKTMWRSFFCAIVAAMTLQRVNPLQNGKLVMFEVTFHHQWKWFEILPFVVIGTFGGLIGTVFIRVAILYSRLRKRSPIHLYPVAEAAVVAFICACINYLVVYLRGDQIELLAALFSECKNSSQDVWNELCNTSNSTYIMAFLLIAALIKLMLMCVVYGTRLPAGMFIPSLAVGALVGRMIGFAMELLQSEVGDTGFFSSCTQTSRCITPGIYAIVGAAAVLGGVTRMTVSLVVVMFELTGGLEYILPIMVSVIVSKWVGDAFGRDGIYDEQIIMNGYPHLDNKAEYSFNERASDIMTTGNLVVLPMRGNTIGSIEQLLRAYRYQGFPVVTNQEEMLVVGYVTREMIIKALTKARTQLGLLDTCRVFFTNDIPVSRDAPLFDLSPFMDQSPIQIVEMTPLDRVIEMFKALGLRHLMVTRHGALVGIIKKKDILEHIQIFHRRDLERSGNAEYDQI